MWRFILLTFAFLGWGFYSMSGGADYEPMAGSLQAPKSTQVKVTELAKSDAAASEKDVQKQVEKPETQEKPVQVALNDIQATNEYDPDADLAVTDASPTALTQAENAASGGDSGKVSGQDSGSDADGVAVTRVEFDSALDAFKGAAMKVTEVSPTGDIRHVLGDNVNLRNGPGTDYGRVDKLASGTEVQVISGAGEEWVQLQVVQSGQLGWMAGRLLSPSKQ